METDRVEVLLENLKGRLESLLEDYAALHERIDARFVAKPVKQSREEQI
ncbi:hypothetical protein [Geomonas silvestris]|nr:hypothetical protein [Geomonas silvestris]